MEQFLFISDAWEWIVLAFVFGRGIFGISADGGDGGSDVRQSEGISSGDGGDADGDDGSSGIEEGSAVHLSTIFCRLRHFIVTAYRCAFACLYLPELNHKPVFRVRMPWVFTFRLISVWATPPHREERHNPRLYGFGPDVHNNHYTTEHHITHTPLTQEARHSSRLTTRTHSLLG